MKSMTRFAVWTVVGTLLSIGLSACDKVEKATSAGGGSSTQSVMNVKGAAR
jgi:hypothetical protein